MRGIRLEDQRRSLRTPVSAEAKILVPTGVIHDGHVIDVSETGMAMTTAGRVEAGSECAVAVELPTFPVRRLNVWATVVYCSVGKEASRIGMEFKDMDAHSRDYIRCLARGSVSSVDACSPFVTLG